MIDSNRAQRVSIAFVIVLVSHLVAGPMLADAPALKLRAMAAGPPAVPLTIDLFRWSSDAERAPLLTALSAPAAPATPPPATTPAASSGRGGRAGRGGRGAAPPPPSPLARLGAAVKAAPTLGYIWGSGPTGYSIKYAWHSASPADGQRIVLVTDRRLGTNQPPGPAGSDAPADAELTVIEMRLDGAGKGEAKTSFGTGVVMDSAANTLALGGYSTAPVLLKVTR